jgi:hypothetical protein
MAARNDGYAGNFLERMERSLETIVDPEVLEVVIVEWMPPTTTPWLIQRVKWPDHLRGRIRIITVPGEGPMREYLAKNVGIQRARGEWILSTNPDILFPKRLWTERIKGEDFFVRAIRRDIIQNGTNGDRHADLGHTGLLTNACGDFLMMTKKNWQKIGGYFESESPAHVDSLAVFRADQAGLTQVFLESDIVHQWHTENLVGKSGFDLGMIGMGNEGPWGMEGVELPEERI